MVFTHTIKNHILQQEKKLRKKITQIPKDYFGHTNMAVLMSCENQGLFLYPPHMIKKTPTDQNTCFPQWLRQPQTLAGKPLFLLSTFYMCGTH